MKKVCIASNGDNEAWLYWRENINNPVLQIIAVIVLDEINRNKIEYESTFETSDCGTDNPEKEAEEFIDWAKSFNDNLATIVDYILDNELDAEKSFEIYEWYKNGHKVYNIDCDWNDFEYENFEKVAQTCNDFFDIVDKTNEKDFLHKRHFYIKVPSGHLIKYVNFWDKESNIIDTAADYMRQDILDSGITEYVTTEYENRGGTFSGEYNDNPDDEGLYNQILNKEAKSMAECWISKCLDYSLGEDWI